MIEAPKLALTIPPSAEPGAPATAWVGRKRSPDLAAVLWPLCAL